MTINAVTMTDLHIINDLRHADFIINASHATACTAMHAPAAVPQTFHQIKLVHNICSLTNRNNNTHTVLFDLQ